MIESSMVYIPDLTSLSIFIQDNSQSPPLIAETLGTLLKFLSWIPLGYIFETKLISTLIYKVTLNYMI